MRKIWRSLIIISIFLAATLFIGCTDEPDNKDDNNVPDDEDDNDGNISDDDGSGDDDDTPKDPQISGFNFNLETGTFWNYYWKTEDYSWVQGNDPSTDTFIGDFKVELGATVDIEGVNAFVVSTSGDSTDEDFNFAPAWTHLAVNGNQLLSSSDGLTLQVIFDGMTGKWTGGGFFTSFPDDTEITAKSGQISNEYIETSAYSVVRKLKQINLLN